MEQHLHAVLTYDGACLFMAHVNMNKVYTLMGQCLYIHTDELALNEMGVILKPWRTKGC